MSFPGTPSTLTINVPASTAPGIYTILCTASGTLSQTFQVFLNVVASLPAQAPQSVLHSFDSTSLPVSLIQASDGNFYGVDTNGGANLAGELYRMTPAGAVTPLYNFCSNGDPSTYTCPDGQNPTTLIQGGDGNFYGTTYAGGASGGGTVYQMTPSGTLTTLYNFCSVAPCSDGGFPQALIQGSDGNFYGTTMNGGAISALYGASYGGTVFQLTPSGTLTTLYNFDYMDAAYALIQGSDGNLYGTTLMGGANSDGSVFQLTLSGTMTTLYSFSLSDGRQGSNALIQGADGNFYGTMPFGGPNDAGTFFQLTPSGVLTTLHSFCSDSPCLDGSTPGAGATWANGSSALIQGGDGNFYGTAESGGAGSGGTVYQMTPSGTLTTLYNFCFESSCSDGYQIFALIQGSDGSFYGTTRYGGANNYGVIYSLSPSPAVPAPVQLSFSSAQVSVGDSTTLSWQVLNGTSATMQQCYAFVQNGDAGAGDWTGKQTGTASSGVYSGSATITPTADGTYTYALTCGGIESGFATLTVGAPALPLAVTTSSLPGATVGTAYSQTLAASGGVPPYAWSVSNGILPDGLTLNASTGTISGTPTAAGTSSFTVMVQDSSATPQSAVADESIAVGGAGAVVNIDTGSTDLTKTGLTASVGGSASADIQISSSSGFTGTVNMSCAVSYLGTGTANHPPTCSLSLSQVTVTDASSTTVTLKIATTAGAVSSMRNWIGKGSGAVLAVLLLVCVPRRRWRGTLLATVLCLVAIAGVSGCGGSSSGGSNPPPADPGTTKGSYQVVVTAAAAGSTAATSITVPFTVK